jgi:hypothetical protein
MRGSRIVLLSLAGLVACGGAPQPEAEGDPTSETLGAPGSMTDAERIEEAMSAAPLAISREATIMAFPDAPGGEMRLLREGTNGWVCFPSSPDALAVIDGEDPMCLDAAWQEWAAAWASRRDPELPAEIGIAYMLRGDIGASNVDPFSTGPTPDNEWVRTGPHIMLITADPAVLDHLPTDPETGGPYVMWRGTPYAHVMIPVTD